MNQPFLDQCFSAIKLAHETFWSLMFNLTAKIAGWDKP